MILTALIDLFIYFFAIYAGMSLVKHTVCPDVLTLQEISHDGDITKNQIF